jgi:signal recognition particle subunit SRP54
MLEIVSRGFQRAKEAITGQATLTEENIDQAMRQIRMALLEADVELGVAKGFLAKVKERALGEVVTLAVKTEGKRHVRSPADHFIAICHKELVALMGPQEATPITYRSPYTTIMMVGLQGVGKTTTCGKMAKFLQADGRRPLLVAADTYRPAAQQQLQILGQQLNVPVYAPTGVDPVTLCAQAQQEARAQRCDVIILDTAGRLAIDEPLMAELGNIKARTRPDEVFLVCDAMAGQDAVRTASAFHSQLALSGFIMTKLDGDARGGAALSIKAICGKPIKFLGMGEGLDKLERFRPEGLASRILGMGDIVGLMQDFEQVVDEKQAKADTKKLLTGQFTLDDFLGQLKMIQKMGSVKDLLAKVPGLGGAMPAGAQIDDKAFVSLQAIIQSMTPKERATPSVIDASRKRRIARGSGKKEAEVQSLLDRFLAMQQMMTGFAKQPGFMQQMMRGMKGKNPQDMLGQLDPGLLQKLGGGAGMPPNPFGPNAGKSAPFGMGGLPGMPGMPAAAPGAGSGPTAGADPLAGLTPEQLQALRRMQGAMGAGPRAASAHKDRQRALDKRKAERKARKKARR